MSYWLHCQSCKQWSKSAAPLSEGKYCSHCGRPFNVIKPLINENLDQETAEKTKELKNKTNTANRIKKAEIPLMADTKIAVPEVPELLYQENIAEIIENYENNNILEDQEAIEITETERVMEKPETTEIAKIEKVQQEPYKFEVIETEKGQEEPESFDMDEILDAEETSDISETTEVAEMPEILEVPEDLGMNEASGNDELPKDNTTKTYTPLIRKKGRMKNRRY